MELELNAAQREAVCHKDGPCMVLAGPGSGKTFTLVKRIAVLTGQYQIPPESILVITFTRAAAQEMKQRYLALAGRKYTQVTFGTFHSIFYGILKWAYQLDASNILSEEEKFRLIRQAVRSVYIEWDESKAESEEELLTGIAEDIGNLKNNRIAPEAYRSKYVSDVIFREIYRFYEAERQRRKKLDFDDMLVMCLELFENYPHILRQWQQKFKYIMIDEFQDINPVQYAAIRLLAAPENHLFIVGDDDQSIYEFRGARPSIMLGFGKDYPEMKQIFLNYNYRSTKKIVDASVRVIGHNQDRFPKQFLTAAGDGEDVHVQEVRDPQEESRYVLEEIRKRHRLGIPYADMAVLFRTNSWIRPFAEACMEYQLPIRLKEAIPSLYDHFIAKDIAAYLRLGLGSRRRSDLLMVLNRPKRYISRNSIAGEEGSFEELRRYYCDKDWMQKRISQMEYDVKQIGRMTPYKAVQYIRKTIGYDDFLKEYALEHNMRMEDFQDTLEEISEQAGQFTDIASWFAHMEKCKEQMEEKWKQESGKKKKEVEQDAVALLTLHGAKGLEYDTVFLLGANEDEMPYRKAQSPSAIEEERRMFYVAMTRAKRCLVITFVNEKNGKKQRPSRFLMELLFDI